MPRASTRFSIGGPAGLGFGAGGAAAFKKSLAVPGLAVPND